MSKNTSIPMLAALLGGEMTQKGGRKNTVKEKVTKPRIKRAPETSVGSDFSMPTPAQRMKDHARDAKVYATRRWVDGEISTTKHNQIHARANRVLTNKGPKADYSGTFA